MDPATITRQRKDEAEIALEAVLDAFPDIFGPSCFCPGPDYCTDIPCPSIPATVTRAAWVICVETSDLDPDGKDATVSKTSAHCGNARALGLLSQARKLYGG